MYEACPDCGLKYERQPGYFLGSSYVNYGLTALTITVGYFVLRFGFHLAQNQTMPILVSFIVLFPLWFFRYARALWLASDLRWDPPGDE